MRNNFRYLYTCVHKHSGILTRTSWHDSKELANYDSYGKRTKRKMSKCWLSLCLATVCSSFAIAIIWIAITDNQNLWLRSAKSCSCPGRVISRNYLTQMQTDDMNISSWCSEKIQCFDVQGHCILIANNMVMCFQRAKF